jgi:hypothetical protein
MRAIRYVAAMLAAGAAGGAAAGAQATTVIATTLNLAPGNTTPDYLELTPAGVVVTSNPKMGNALASYGYFGGGADTLFQANPFKTDHIGLVTTTPGLPTLGETFPNTSFNATVSGVGPGVTEYVHLEFITFGQEYLGEATFGADGTLNSISYAAVPEPAAWALLLAGFGMAGAAARTGRKRQLA